MSRNSNCSNKPSEADEPSLVPPSAYPTEELPKVDPEILMQMDKRLLEKEAAGAEEIKTVGTPAEEAIRAVAALGLGDSEIGDLLEALADSTWTQSKSCATDDEIAAAWLAVFQYLDAEARQSLLEGPGSTVLTLSGLRAETKQILATAPFLIAAPSSNANGGEMVIRGGAGGPADTGVSSPLHHIQLGAQQGASGGSTAALPAIAELPMAAIPNPAYANQPEQLFTHEPKNVFERLAEVPPELLLILREHLPPIDELILCHTHPGIFNNATFSFYRLDAQHQKQWARGNPGVKEQRLPLLTYAICNGAPLSIVKELLDTWQKEGLDFDLEWTKPTNPMDRTHDPPLIAPIYVAASHCRADVIEELRRQGADEDELEKHVFAAPFTCPGRHYFSAQRWSDMEEIALEMYAQKRPTGGSQRLTWMQAAAMAGWLRVLRNFLDPVLEAIANGQNMSTFQNFIKNQNRTLLERAGEVREDNSAVIDYLLQNDAVKMTVPTGAWQRNIALDDWLSILIVGGMHSDGYVQPTRHRNAALIIYELVGQNELHWISLVNTMVMYIRHCACSDDSLDLTSALHTGLKSLINQHTYQFLTTPGIHQHDYSPERHPEILRAYMLHIALQSKEGAPNTVYWLTSVAKVYLHLPMPELGSPHALQSLVHAPTIVILQQNVDAILSVLDPNNVIPTKAPLRPIDVIHDQEAVAVEFVSRGNVDVTLAGNPTRQAAMARRRLRSEGIRYVAGDENLCENLARDHVPYSVRHRLLDWCIVNNTNDVPGVIEAGRDGI